MKFPMRTTIVVILLITAGISSGAQAGTNEVPVIDASMGSCTADITVMDSGHHAIYKANISTRIRSGFAGVKKLDLEVGTNVDGKARFTGLPDRPRDVLQFTADYEGRSNTVLLDSQKDCHATLSAFLPDKPVAADK
jgi:hypothetical protein